MSTLHRLLQFRHRQTLDVIPRNNLTVVLSREPPVIS